MYMTQCTTGCRQGIGTTWAQQVSRCYQEVVLAATCIRCRGQAQQRPHQARGNGAVHLARCGVRSGDNAQRAQREAGYVHMRRPELAGQLLLPGCPPQRSQSTQCRLCKCHAVAIYTTMLIVCSPCMQEEKNYIYTSHQG